MCKKLTFLVFAIYSMASFSDQKEEAFLAKMKPFYRSAMAFAIEQEFGGSGLTDKEKEKYVTLFLDTMAGCYLNIIKESYGQKYLAVALDASSQGMDFMKAQEAMQMSLISDIKEGKLDRQVGINIISKAENNAADCVAKSEQAMYSRMSKDGV